MDITVFILKVLALSLAISLAIKHLMPRLAIAPTDTNALIAILLPTAIMAALLLTQRGRHRKSL
jgi:hypothetical protein